jgi:hypothetical protein
MIGIEIAAENSCFVGHSCAAGPHVQIVGSGRMYNQNGTLVAVGKMYGHNSFSTGASVGFGGPSPFSRAIAEPRPDRIPAPQLNGKEAVEPAASAGEKIGENP